MQAIFNVAFPIFGVILTGYLAGKWRILGGEATAALNAFVSYFALPILFFGTLARTPVDAVLDPSLMAGLRAGRDRDLRGRHAVDAARGAGRARHDEPAGHRGVVGQCRLHGRAALHRGVRRGRACRRPC